MRKKQKTKSMKKYIETCRNCGLDVTNNMSQNCFGCGTNLVDNIPVRMPNPQHPSYKNNLAKLDKALKTGKNVSQPSLGQAGQQAENRVKEAA